MNVLSVFERINENVFQSNNGLIKPLTISVVFGWLAFKLYSSKSSSFSPEIRSSLFEEFTQLLTEDPLDETTHLPCVLVDLKSFDDNIELIRKEMLNHPSTTVRIASKSIRVPYLLDRILSSGHPYKGMMCYSVGEAQFLSEMGFDDLLIGYPSEQLSDYQILRNLHEKEKKLIRIVVDNEQSIGKMNEFLDGIREPFPLILEIDVSFRWFNGLIHIGARRSPIRTISQLIQVIQYMKTLSNVRLEGLMVYESHIAGIGDINPANFWLNPVIRFIKSFSIPRIEKIRQEMSQICLKYGLTLFNGGGTGSLLSTLNESSSLTEITVGSAFFQPHLFDHYQQNQLMINKSNYSLTPSCYFALPIVRISDQNQWITCLGGGYVASGKPGWDKIPIPVYPKGLTVSHDEGTGEVQTPLQIHPKTDQQTLELLKNNGIVYFRHAKGGELAERFTHFLLVQNGKIVETPKTYRGFGKCFI